MSYQHQLQKIANEYVRTHGEGTARQIAQWAITSHVWEAPASLGEKKLADELSRAMREEYFTDPSGRRTRAKHVRREARNGVQLNFWGDMRNMPRHHMDVSLKQRRQAIVGDCHQLKVDMDSYNEHWNQDLSKPIQIVFDFTRDLAEIEAGDQKKVA
jgi:hypothetical protein